MKKGLMATLVAGLLAIASSAAWAVPLTMTLEVTHSGAGGAAGWWTLAGPTNLGASFVTDTDYDVSHAIDEGSYQFTITGLQGGFGVTSWLLNIGSERIAGESHGVFLISAFKDKVAFHSVPEPTSLALFGAGLIGLGLMRRRIRS